MSLDHPAATIAVSAPVAAGAIDSLLTHTFPEWLVIASLIYTCMLIGWQGLKYWHFFKNNKVIDHNDDDLNNTPS